MQLARILHKGLPIIFGRYLSFAIICALLVEPGCSTFQQVHNGPVNGFHATKKRSPEQGYAGRPAGGFGYHLW